MNEWEIKERKETKEEIIMEIIKFSIERNLVITNTKFSATKQR